MAVDFTVVLFGAHGISRVGARLSSYDFRKAIALASISASRSGQLRLEVATNDFSPGFNHLRPRVVVDLV